MKKTKLAKWLSLFFGATLAVAPVILTANHSDIHFNNTSFLKKINDNLVGFDNPTISKIDGDTVVNANYGEAYTTRTPYMIDYDVDNKNLDPSLTQSWKVSPATKGVTIDQNGYLTVTDQAQLMNQVRFEVIGSLIDSTGREFSAKKDIRVTVNYALPNIEIILPNDSTVIDNTVGDQGMFQFNARVTNKPFINPNITNPDHFVWFIEHQQGSYLPEGISIDQNTGVLTIDRHVNFIKNQNLNIVVKIANTDYAGTASMVINNWYQVPRFKSIEGQKNISLATSSSRRFKYHANFFNIDDISPNAQYRWELVDSIGGINISYSQNNRGYCDLIIPESLNLPQDIFVKLVCYVSNYDAQTNEELNYGITISIQKYYTTSQNIAIIAGSSTAIAILIAMIVFGSVMVAKRQSGW